ncbi:MAG TPA: ABC transporter permease, partial [Bradyrhizobium sp.]
MVPAVLLALWWLATRNEANGLIPSPSDVVGAITDLAVGDEGDAFSGSLLGHILASTGRVYGAFALAALAALPLGILIGRLQLARALLDPLLQLLRPIPVTAWLPLSMIFFGLGPNAAIFLVFLGAFYPILLNTVFGVRSIDPRL